MARVRFTRDFDYQPTGRTTIGYLAGMEMTVRRECADQALKVGAAVELGSATSTESEDEQDTGATALGT